MFGMSMWEIIVILAVALIVLGPKKLPELAKSLGRAIGEFKRATSEIKDAVDFDSEPKSYQRPPSGKTGNTSAEPYDKVDLSDKNSLSSVNEENDRAGDEKKIKEEAGNG